MYMYVMICTLRYRKSCKISVNVPWAERFINANFFHSFYRLKVFNHLASLVCDIIEITNEKNDGLFEENPDSTEEVWVYNIVNSEKPALFAKLIHNTVNDELGNWLNRDIIGAIAFGIEEENEEHLIKSWTNFTTQVREKANVRKCLF